MEIHKAFIFSTLQTKLKMYRACSEEERMKFHEELLSKKIEYIMKYENEHAVKKRGRNFIMNHNFIMNY